MTEEFESALRRYHGFSGIDNISVLKAGRRALVSVGEYYKPKNAFIPIPTHISSVDCTLSFVFSEIHNYIRYHRTDPDWEMSQESPNAFQILKHLHLHYKNCEDVNIGLVGVFKTKQGPWFLFIQQSARGLRVVPYMCLLNEIVHQGHKSAKFDSDYVYNAIQCIVSKTVEKLFETEEWVRLNEVQLRLVSTLRKAEHFSVGV